MAQPTAAQPPNANRIRLGELLIREGLLTAEQCQRGLEEQKSYGGRLGRHLVELGFISDGTLLDALARQLKIPRVDLDVPGIIQSDVARYARADLCEQWGFCPIAHDPKRNVLAIAVSDPDPQLLNDIEGFLAQRVEPRIAPQEMIDRAVRRIFHGEGGQPMKAIQGLQRSRTAGSAGSGGPSMSDELGPANAQPPPPQQPPPQAMAMPAVSPFDAQMAQQVAMQQQLQAQLQQQLHMQQMQHLQLQAQQGFNPGMPQPAQGGMPYPPQGYPAAPGYPTGYFTPDRQPSPPAPAPAAPHSAPPLPRAAPALPTPGPPNLEDLADQLNRLEKTLAAQARALRSLVDVLVDRGMLSKAEMARKQQGYGK